MPYNNAFLLKKYPFVRLLACLVAGILLQLYLQFSILRLIEGFCAIVLFLLLFIFIPSSIKFRLGWLRGACIVLLFVVAGAVITFTKDVRHNPQWAGSLYKPGQAALLTVEEPLVEKPASWKALASITAIQDGGVWKKVYGKVLLYFYKGKNPPHIYYGMQIIVHQPLQPIKNNGNPGEVNYKQYCLMQDIAFQAFIYPGQFVAVPGNQGNGFKQALFNARDAVIATLQKNIPGEKEQGVAEALLIGYRAGLDTDLVQAYTNAGIIHIIAISGLHQAMIYALLAGIWGLFPINRVTRIVKPVSIFVVLWAFALLAGAMPSICRATIMFSFIILGQAIGKTPSTYNNLAASAFLLLVYNPFYLGDAGFILSYSAVLSIVIFYRPVYNLVYVKNKVLDKAWATIAVTISVQILTLPVVIFYFHQFANFFIVTNLIAVPLSCFILYGEIVLLLFSFVAPLAKLVGVAVGFALQCLDGLIEWINKMPFALWGNIYADVPQTLLLYACIITACIWLLRRSAKSLTLSLSFLTALVVYTVSSSLSSAERQKLIVYNVFKQTAIDIVQGTHYQFIGDSALLGEGTAQRYNLKPCRIMYRLSPSQDSSLNYALHNVCITVHQTKILLLDDNFNIAGVERKIPVDVIILSKKPKLTMAEINDAFSFKQLVFDSSNPVWKIRGWKKDCDSLHLRFYSVPEQGAFEMNL